MSQIFLFNLINCYSFTELYQIFLRNFISTFKLDYDKSFCSVSDLYLSGKNGIGVCAFL